MTKDEFWEGVRGGFPIMLAASPFGALFGALAVDNGFTIADAVFMSASVYAGASQMVGIELFGNHVQPWLVVLSVFAVNFRHVLYSASIAKYVRHFTFGQKFLAFFLLVDPQYAETEKRGERGLPITFAWYLGFGLVIYIPWIFNTLVGAIFGQMIGDPKAIGLDILLPVYFMGWSWASASATGSCRSLPSRRSLRSPACISSARPGTSASGRSPVSCLQPVCRRTSGLRRRARSRRRRDDGSATPQPHLPDHSRRGRDLLDARRRLYPHHPDEADPAAAGGGAERRACSGTDDAGRPAFVYGGFDVTIAMFVAFAIALGLSLSTLRMLVIGWVVVMLIRHVVM